MELYEEFHAQSLEQQRKVWRLELRPAWEIEVLSRQRGPDAADRARPKRPPQRGQGRCAGGPTYCSRPGLSGLIAH